MKLSTSFASVFLIFFLCFACTDDGTEATVNDNSDLSILRLEIANHLATNLIQPSFRALTISASDLENKVGIFADELNEVSLTALKNSLSENWKRWQYASLYQYGPAESNALRNMLNTYPTNAEKIENNIQEKLYALGSFTNFEASGFPAIDYLINADDVETTLAKFRSDESRIDYLKQLASIIQISISNTDTQFLKGDFIQNFTSTDASGMDVGSAIGLQVNAIDFHFQRAVRDGKVSIPAGIRSSGIPRPKATEAYYGGYSSSLLLNSLRAYSNLFKGIGLNKSVGPSIYAYLEEINQAQLAVDIELKLSDAISLAENLDDNLTTQIKIDNQKMINLFLAMQEVVTLIKSDMVSVMGITITNQDNDGD